MNGDGDLGFIDQLVQAVEAVRARVRTESLDAECFAEVKDLLVGIVVVVKTLDAIGDGLDIVVRTKLQNCLDLVRTAVKRGMLLEEFDKVQPELLGALEGRFAVKIPKAITLGAHDKAAERIGFLVLG